MKNINIKVNINQVDKDGYSVESKTSINVELPFKCWRTSDISGFQMQPNGKGSYLGPNQMFGGPSGGDIVFYNNVGKNNTGQKYYAVITGSTQDWHKRECSLKVVCWDYEMRPRIIEGLKNEFSKSTITEKEFMEHMIPYMGFEKTVDICISLSKVKLKSFIEQL